MLDPNSDPELKPCPFCGCKHIEIYARDVRVDGEFVELIWAECPCGARTRDVDLGRAAWRRSAEMVAKLWNRREAPRED